MADCRSKSPPRVPLQPRDFMVLLALAGGHNHGIGLIREIARLTDDRVPMDPANLHRALQRLVRDGWVEDLGRLDRGDARRRFYAITERGIELARTEALRLDRLSAVARVRLDLGSPEKTS